MHHKIFYVGLFLLITSCTSNTINIENERAGELKASFLLIENNEKKFRLDAETAPKPPFIQIIEDSLGKRILTFLNPYKNAIYCYDYTDSIYLNKFVYQKEGADAVLRLSGYYIKNMDSIYIYNMPMTEIILANCAGKINNRISLRGNMPDWPNYYPQYLLETVNPFIQINNKLRLTGQSFISIPSANIDKFKFSACVDMQNNQVEFQHTYPKEIYGQGSNWEGGLPTQVYPVLSPKGDLIYSFPASHNLYVAKLDSEIYTTIYGGSNFATTIHSIDFDDITKTPDELIINNYMREDMYGAVLHDPYRKMYYRFLLKGVQNSNINAVKEDKPIIVIMMNEEFNYLGETVIGTGKEWNWTNSFVTREGLNIEYIDSNDIDENYLALKIFIPKEI